jgi:hypothetical protein
MWVGGGIQRVNPSVGKGPTSTTTGDERQEKGPGLDFPAPPTKVCSPECVEGEFCDVGRGVRSWAAEILMCVASAALRGER